MLQSKTECPASLPSLRLQSGFLPPGFTKSRRAGALADGLNWSWPPPFPDCPHGFTHLNSPESPDPVLPCSHHCLQSETAHTTSVCAFFYYPYKLNHRQLFLNSQAVFYLQTFKYTAPLPRVPFPVSWALSTPAGQQLLQEASTVWIRCSWVLTGTLCLSTYHCHSTWQGLAYCTSLGFSLLLPSRTVEGKCMC